MLSTGTILADQLRTSCDEYPADRELLCYAYLRAILCRVHNLAQLDLWQRNEVTQGREQLLVVRNKRTVVEVACGEEEVLSRDLRWSEQHAAECIYEGWRGGGYGEDVRDHS